MFAVWRELSELLCICPCRKFQAALVITHIRAQADAFKLTSTLHADVCFSAQASRRSMCHNQGDKSQYN